jgi:thymidylate synthase (FAD)
MNVKLLEHIPLWVCAQAIRDCYDSHHLSDTTEDHRKGILSEECGEKDKKLIYKVGVQNHHASTLEHLVYNFDIDGISRACLQELARHRMASYSVKSTRYTLRELKKEDSFIVEDKINLNTTIEPDGYKRASKFVVLTDEPVVNQSIIRALDNLRYLTTTTIKNDKIKYALPDAYKTSLTWTVNARSLQNFLSLRTHHKALWEIQNLAQAVFKALPEEHKYLFEGFLNKGKENE